MARATAVLFILASVAFAFAGGSACTSEDASPGVPTRACGLRVWHKPASAEAHVEVIGDWDGWKRPGRAPEKRPDGWRVAAIDVPPGEHSYAIVEDGVWLTDKNEPMTGSYEEREVSVAIAPDCERPAVRVDNVETTAAGSAIVHVTFVSARSGKPIDPASVSARGRDGGSLRVTSIDAARGAVTLEATELARGKYPYALEARDTAGTIAEDARATVWIDARS
ncbi:MAG: Neopullulanase, partial [Labilithrix sp.]|nr:Neopullulanase [Labilithrix sp.]